MGNVQGRFPKDWWTRSIIRPTIKEDSDIFNRFVLAGYDLVQTWKGLVYHMTSRGSRFKDGAMRNPAGQVFMKGRESSEWLAQNLRSTRTVSYTHLTLPTICSV